MYFWKSNSVQWLSIPNITRMCSASYVCWQCGTTHSCPPHAMLLCAVQQSIDISCQPGPQQQTCSSGPMLGQTDQGPTNRYIDPAAHSMRSVPKYYAHFIYYRTDNSAFTNTCWILTILSHLVFDFAAKPKVKIQCDIYTDFINKVSQCSRFIECDDSCHNAKDGHEKILQGNSTH